MATQNKIELIISAQVEQAKSRLQGLLKTLSGLGTVIAAMGIARFARDITELGLAFTMTQARLAGTLGSLEAARGLMAAIQESTGGAVDQMQAAELALAAVNFGFAKSVDQTARFARNILLVSGGSGEAANEFMRMLANGVASIRVLDRYGISAGVVRARMEELRAETQGLTADEAFVTAVLEQLDVKAEELAGTMDTTAGKAQRLSGALRDLKQDAGEAAVLGLTPVLDTLMAVNEQIESLSLSGTRIENFFSLLWTTLPPGALMSIPRILELYREQGDQTISGLARAIEAYRIEIGATSTELSRAADEQAAMEALAARAAQTIGDEAGAADELADSMQRAADKMRAAQQASDAARNSQLAFMDAFDQFAGGTDRAGLKGLASVERAGTTEMDREQIARVILNYLIQNGASLDVIWQFRRAAGLATDREIQDEQDLMRLANAAIEGKLSGEQLASGMAAILSGDRAALNQLQAQAGRPSPHGPLGGARCSTGTAAGGRKQPNVIGAGSMLGIPQFSAGPAPELRVVIDLRSDLLDAKIEKGMLKTLDAIIPDSSNRSTP